MQKVQLRCFKIWVIDWQGGGFEFIGQYLGGRGELKEREMIILKYKLKERFMEKYFKCIK